LRNDVLEFRVNAAGRLKAGFQTESSSRWVEAQNIHGLFAGAGEAGAEDDV
jgi:hypothetical protein